VQTSLEKRLVRVNVADPGYHPLIEQDGFERTLSGREPLPPVASVEVKRLRSQAHLLEKIHQGVGLGKQRGTPKSPDVTETKLQSVADLQNQVCMREPLFRGRHHSELARHSEVDNQVRPSLQTQDNPFAPPANIFHLSADQDRVPGRRPGAAQAVFANANALQPPSDQLRPQIADYRFNFRQLGHWTGTPLWTRWEKDSVVIIK
jgi:hypothetical protein